MELCWPPIFHRLFPNQNAPTQTPPATNDGVGPNPSEPPNRLFVPPSPAVLCVVRVERSAAGDKLFARGIMIHQPLGGAQGQALDVRIQAREILHLRPGNRAERERELRRERTRAGRGGLGSKDS